MEKLPPEEKVYEAWTAIADGRVNIDEAARTATVRSSDGTQTYTIQWDADRREYSSNDNASYWRGYPGYPVIADRMKDIDAGKDAGILVKGDDGIRL